VKNIKRLIFSALLLLAICSPLAAYDYRDFENHLFYWAYVAGKGWQGPSSHSNQGEVVGMPGESRAICGIMIWVDEFSPMIIDQGISYRVHMTHSYQERNWWGYKVTRHWSGWSEWNAHGNEAGMRKSNGDIDETYLVDGIEIKVENPVPEYAMSLATYSGAIGWQEVTSLSEPSGNVHIGIDTGGTGPITGFMINVWGVGPGYLSL